MEAHFLRTATRLCPGGTRGHLAVKAGAALGVAATPAVLFDPQDEGVLVAIGQQFDDFLELAARGTFVPELLAAAAPIHGLSFFDGLAQGFRVHVGQHQGGTGLRVQSHGRDQAIGIEFRGKGQPFLEGVFGFAGGKLDRFGGAGTHCASVASLGGLPK